MSFAAVEMQCTADAGFSFGQPVGVWGKSIQKPEAVGFRIGERIGGGVGQAVVE